MNDFTKEELFEIFKGISALYNNDGLLSQRVLLEKIQSMIDGWCTHRPKARIEDADGNEFCGDCGEYVNE